MSTRTSTIVRLLANAPAEEMFRATTQPKMRVSRVSRTGGDYGGGMIEGYSLITHGEALGHRMWIDDNFLDQVHASVTDTGIKSRFTHPDMSADGLAKFLGRTKSLERIDGQVIGDLHLAKSARRSPDGDLAGYVLARTLEDPESFGASIVFYRDRDAEIGFMLEHGATEEEDEDGLHYIDITGFVSPDPLNINNYPHSRLLELSASDLVDDPAANPSGMFASDPITGFAELADYALGICESPPSETAFGVHPDRLRGFVERYLSNRKLTIHKGAVMAKKPAEQPKPAGAPEATPAELNEGVTVEAPVEASASTATPVVTPEPETPPDPRAELKAKVADYAARFGAELGAQWAIEDKPIADAYSEFVERLTTAHAAQLADVEGKLAAAESEATTLKARIAQLGSLAAGEAEPLTSTPAETKEKSGPPTAEERYAMSAPEGIARFAAGLRLPKAHDKN
jgi:hypothetical protein